MTSRESPIQFLLSLLRIFCIGLVALGAAYAYGNNLHFLGHMLTLSTLVWFVSEFLRV